ncbi:MAG: ribonuclease J [Deltaproteobacteria bacterium]|jgi:ribonuclease J|nr:ribonuclease J [Deltaproteobacteria bacterium]
MLKLIPLGGLGEIGLNMTALEYGDDILVVDSGLMFPEEYMPGVDVVIPDIQYLRDNRERVKWIVLTHGHEDHIGAMPFLLREFDLPVFGTSFTIELLKEKLREHNLPQEARLQKVKPGEISEFGPFKIEYIRVNHSIPDGVGLAIDTPEGILVHSGDFRMDQTPVDGQATDLLRFAHYGERGVLALLSDSTNVEKEGFTLSEREVSRTLEGLMESSGGRVIVAVFASNITRIQQVVHLASRFHRKIHFSGKSMRTNVRIAKEEGLLHVPPDLEIEEHEIDRMADDRVVMITTGSQGEPMSSLTRMAENRHKGVKIRKGDMVILSSRFIPGNERAITAIINNLYRMGAEVVYERVSDIHSSGHAYQEELKLMLHLVKPKYFIPVHGEYRHLVKHAQLAGQTGIPSDRLILVEDGMPVCFDRGEATVAERVQTGRVLVDGKGVGDIGDVVLRDRRRLSGDGVVVVLLGVDEQTGDIIYGPEIVSRGFVFEDHSGFMLEEAKSLVLQVVNEIENRSHIDWAEVAPDIKKSLKRYFFNTIERRPLILPIIMPV